MEATCQRCHETLREADRYCAVCGLPQLTYQVAETPVVPLGSEAVPALGLANEPFGLADGIAWRPALKTALMLAVPAGFLCLGILPIGLLGTVFAGIFAVSLYIKNTSSGRISTGAGARIGLVTGLFAAWLTVGLYAAQLWTTRFLFRQGSEWDSMWQSQIEKSLEANQLGVAQVATAGTQAAQLTQTFRNTLLSVEGRAGWALSGLLFFAVLLVLFAIIGGAVGARFLAQPRRPSA